jgi:hypothetical protein
MTTSDAKTFLKGWFDRLEKTGWEGSIFLEALADDLMWAATGRMDIAPVTGRGVNGVGRGTRQRV